MTNSGLVARQALSENELTAVKQLEEICSHADGIMVKFNWSMMTNRDLKHINDFCWYQEGRLAGYMPLDDFGGAFEITAAVLPEFRRQGIFRQLFEAARREARNRQATSLLLVNYRASESGTAAIKHLDVTYKSSEYCMEAHAASIPTLPASRLQLEEVTPENVEDLSRMLAVNFEGDRWNAPEALLKELQREDRRYYIARLEERRIGHIGVLTEESGVYIRAVGIVPEWRHKGYGRQLLAITLQKMLDEGYQRFELDVATENSQALTLYQSCGFHETNVYDYYTVPLS